MMTNLLSPSECGVRKHHLCLTAHGFISMHDYVVHVDLTIIVLSFLVHPVLHCVMQDHKWTI